MPYIRTSGVKIKKTLPKNNGAGTGKSRKKIRFQVYLLGKYLELGGVCELLEPQKTTWRHASCFLSKIANLNRRTIERDTGCGSTATECCFGASIERTSIERSRVFRGNAAEDQQINDLRETAPPLLFARGRPNA